MVIVLVDETVAAAAVLFFARALTMLRIAIVGAGITGLATALFLSRAGHQIKLFEQATTPGPPGSGLLLQPPGMLALQSLGLLELAVACGQPITRLRGTNRRGRCVMDLTYSKWKPGWFGLGIQRGALWSLLHAAVVGARIQVDANCKVERVADDGTLQCRSGDLQDDDEPFDLIIAADGSRSALRHAHVVDSSKEYEWGALWATLSLPTGWEHSTLLQRYAGAHQMMGALPVGADQPGGAPQVTLFWSERARDLDASRADVGTWRRRASALWPEAEVLIAQVYEPAQLIPARYLDVRPHTTLARRVLLIGDAAHGTSPQLGQGASLGLLDALMLSRSLSGADNPTSLSGSLREFVASRHSHVRYYQWASRMLTPFFQSDQAWLAKVRDLLFEPVSRLPYVGGEFRATLVGAKSGILFGRLDESLQGPSSFFERSMK